MRLLVDTSAWVALRDRRDQNFASAKRTLVQLKTENILLLTTDYIVDETVTLMRNRLSHREAVVFLDLCRRSERIRLLRISKQQFAAAEEIFRKYDDKTWSFTDCVSFAVMDELGLTLCFAFDRHFIQYGKAVIPVP